MERINKIPIPALFFSIAVLIATSCQNNKSGSHDTRDSGKGAFGDSVPVSNGLLGKVFLLPDTTKHLPDFDTLTPLPDRLYATEINVPGQSWSAGFPGLRGRFEWFGIEYTGSFKPTRSATYRFKLISDDGSKLYIDDKLVIDNDGIHSEWPGRDTLYLSDAIHTIKIRYFQGPKYFLALQLYWGLPDSADKIFPGKEFVLYPPAPASRWWIWLLIALAALALGYFILKRRSTPGSKGSS
jgi:PA14 domain